MDIGINPDIAVFGKTIANGFAMGAIIGKKKIMQNVTRTFISSAFWTERIGPSCALTFIKKHKKINLGKILNNKGIRIKNIWLKAAKNADIDISIKGINPLASFKLHTKDWRIANTYFIQEMLKRKILASDRCYSNYMHSDKLMKIYENACIEIFEKISKLEKRNLLLKNLDGPKKQMDFGRLTN